MQKFTDELARNFCLLNELIKQLFDDFVHQFYLRINLQAYASVKNVFLWKIMQ